MRYSDDGHADEGLFNVLRVASVTPSLVDGVVVLTIVFSGVPASVQSTNLISRAFSRRELGVIQPGWHESRVWQWG